MPTLTDWVHSHRVAVDPSTGCWTWTGRIMKLEGYGAYNRSLAHRLAYEYFVGPIPAEFSIDHLCRNRACVNPEHLEAVTQGENVRRGLYGSLKTTCAQGHPWGPDTWVNNGNGRRCCGICKQKRDAGRKR